MDRLIFFKNLFSFLFSAPNPLSTKEIRLYLYREKVSQTAEQNVNEVKAPSENTMKLKLTSDEEHHENCQLLRK